MSAVMGAGMGQPQYEAAPTGGVNVRTLRVAGDGDVVDDINKTRLDAPGINPSDLVVFIHAGSLYFWVGGTRTIGYGQPPITEEDLEAIVFGQATQISDIPGLAFALEKGKEFTSNSLDTVSAGLQTDFVNRQNILQTELSTQISEHVVDPNNPHGIAHKIAQQIQKHLGDPNPHPEYVKPDALNAYVRKGYAKLVHSGDWTPGVVWEDWHTIGGWAAPTVTGVGIDAKVNYHGFVAQDFGLWQARVALVLEHTAAQMNRSIGLCLAQDGGEELDTAVFGTQMGASMTNVNADLLIKVPDRTPVQLRIKAGNEYRKVKVLAGSITMVKL